MPRKSEVMQLDLQREFCTTMTALKDIWDEIGIPDEQIEIRGNTVRLHLRNLLAGMVNEEEQLKKRMLESVRNHKREIVDLTNALALPDFELPPDLTIMQHEKGLRVHLSKLKKLKHERIRKHKELQTNEQELCDQLCSTPYYVPSNAVPSEAQLAELEKHISALREEKERRWSVYRSKKTEIVGMYDEMEIVPETSFAQDLITDMEDSFVLTTNNLDELSSLHSELVKKKQEMNLLVEGLWSQIQLLRERLEIEDTERRIKDAYPGIKPNDIEGLRKELSNLEDLKRGSLQKLTERSRSEIAALWDKCYYSKDQRHEFSPACEESYTEELLNQHEEELAKLHAYYEEHSDLFSNVGKWQLLFNRMLDLECKAGDINRFANRGGNLLQEEKERKKIQKKLPKIEEDLLRDIKNWEEENGKRFLVEGIAFKEYVHSQWEACEQRKKSGKLQRQEKKKVEMESEMVFGSMPKTPTKRRFISTTTMLNVPTDHAKKTKGVVDNTCRNVLTSKRTNVNRTAATCLSPGKPPISRQRTPTCQNSGKNPRSRTTTKATDMMSVKSASSDSTQQGVALSTTVVSSSTTSSAKSAPLLDSDPSLYNDFAEDINNQAKQNKAVRSSAICDLKR